MPILGSTYSHEISLSCVFFPSAGIPICMRTTHYIQYQQFDTSMSAFSSRFILIGIPTTYNRNVTIVKLDLDQQIAIAKPSNVKYFTSCRDHTDVNTMDRLSRSPTNSVALCLYGISPARECTPKTVLAGTCIA